MNQEPKPSRTHEPRRAALKSFTALAALAVLAACTSPKAGREAAPAAPMTAGTETTAAALPTTKAPSPAETKKSTVSPAKAREIVGLGTKCAMTLKSQGKEGGFDTGENGPDQLFTMHLAFGEDPAATRLRTNGEAEVRRRTLNLVGLVDGKSGDSPSDWRFYTIKGHGAGGIETGADQPKDNDYTFQLGKPGEDDDQVSTVAVNFTTDVVATAEPGRVSEAFDWCRGSFTYSAKTQLWTFKNEFPGGHQGAFRAGVQG